MIRAIFVLLIELRNLSGNLFNKIFQQLRDPQTGKIKGINPNKIGTVFKVLAFIFFLTVLIFNLTQNR